MWTNKVIFTSKIKQNILQFKQKKKHHLDMRIYNVHFLFYGVGVVVSAVAFIGELIAARIFKKYL